MSKIIYHITTMAEWQIATEKGFYAAASLPIEGFIHCCTNEQINGVLERYFADIDELVKLTIDITKLVAPLKYELAPSVNQEFPHVYGNINLDAVINITEIE